MVERFIIHHPKFGRYEQLVYETVEEAGHKPLPSEGKFGWNMPTDQATQEFISKTQGRVVFEIGVGLGDTVVIPVLEEGAAIVYAMDITSQNIRPGSFMVETARSLNRLDALKIHILEENWWNQDLQEKPTVASILLTDQTNPTIPPENSVDLMMARHVLQFGDPEKVIRFFDLASAALKYGGSVTAINFTPYTHYLYEYDNGQTMKLIHITNRKFSDGEIEVPGGFIHPKRGFLKISLYQLMKRPELNRGEENSFLYFDHSTLVGLFERWSKTRKQRMLPTDLELEESYYFSPLSIAKINKLVEEPEFSNMENHVFTLRKS